MTVGELKKELEMFHDSTELSICIEHKMRRAAQITRFTDKRAVLCDVRFMSCYQGDKNVDSQ